MKKIMDEVKKNKKAMIGVAVVVVIFAWMLITNEPAPTVAAGQTLCSLRIKQGCPTDPGTLGPAASSRPPTPPCGSAAASEPLPSPRT